MLTPRSLGSAIVSDQILSASRSNCRGYTARRIAAALAMLALLTGFGSSGVLAAEPAAAPTRAAPIPVKVLVINMFGPEAEPWIKALAPSTEIRVPGLSSDYPTVHCSDDGVCQMTTGMGHANAAASVMAVIYSGLFDLRRAYILIAGIAGIDPAQGTLGSAAWAHYVVDSGIAHEIDAREMPSGWSEGYFGVLTDAPGKMPKLEYRSEVFELDGTLLNKALELSRSATLEDTEDMRMYRKHFPNVPANQPPAVIQCDTLSADTWWTGRRLGEHARAWTRLLTDGKGRYCTSQQEDNATLEALTRGSESALLDLHRVAVLRTGSDFDRPYPHQSAYAGLRDQFKLTGPFPAAAHNLLHAGMPLVADIVKRWDLWQSGVPK